MWKHQTFDERTLGTGEEVREAVTAFLNQNNLSPADVQIAETRMIGLTGPTANLSITVYWCEAEPPTRRRL